jgi:hypothetical protein
MQATRNRKKGRGRSAAQSGTPTPTGADSIRAAALKWHVPVWILAGVKLIETGSGSGIGEVSSAGAKGPFQFIDSTAAEYEVNVNDFNSSADGAAHYLHDLKKSTGSWNAALQSYSGGGYGLAEVNSKLGEFGLSKAAIRREERAGTAQNVGLFKDFKKGLDKAFGWSLGGVLGGGKTAEGLEQKDPGKVLEGTVTNPLGALGDLVSALLDVQTWVRIAEVLGGAALIYVALKALTGQGVSDLPGYRVARAAAKV